MFYISAVNRSEPHQFKLSSARNLNSAKTLATKLVNRSEMKAAVAFASFPTSSPVPLAEIVFSPGCAWQSLLPNLHPVALHHD